jgi:hypothetical protein
MLKIPFPKAIVRNLRHDTIQFVQDLQLLFRMIRMVRMRGLAITFDDVGDLYAGIAEAIT